MSYAQSGGNDMAWGMDYANKFGLKPWAALGLDLSLPHCSTGCAEEGVIKQKLGAGTNRRQWILSGPKHQLFVAAIQLKCSLGWYTSLQWPLNQITTTLMA